MTQENLRNGDTAKRIRVTAMEPGRPIRIPWRSWNDLPVGHRIFHSGKKSWRISGGRGHCGLVDQPDRYQTCQDTIIERARIRLHGDLASAVFMLRTTYLETLLLKVKPLGDSKRVQDMVEQGNSAGLTNVSTVLRSKTGSIS